MVHEHSESHANRPLEAGQIPDLLLPGCELDWFLAWPPDLLALTSMLLGMSDSYRYVVDPPDEFCWPPSENYNGKKFDRSKGPKSWEVMVRETGREWQEQIEDTQILNQRIYDLLLGESPRQKRPNPPLNVPDGLLGYWNIAKSFIEEKRPLRELSPAGDEMDDTTWRVVTSLLTLHAIADEAGRGLFLRGAIEDPRRATEIHLYVLRRLKLRGTLASIHPDRVRVLPKMHTPRVGMALRSLSHHMGFHRSAVDVRFLTINPERENKGLLNLLLLPWPRMVEPTSFKRQGRGLLRLAEHKFETFVYDPESKAIEEDLDERLPYAIQEARRVGGKVDVVVMPELALPNSLVQKFEDILRKEQVPAYVAGICDPGNGQTPPSAQNFVRLGWKFDWGGGIATERKFEAIEQHKHHRWFLDASQIVQYHLGGQLRPDRTWWESIRIRKRALNFFRLGQNLLMCPLICEDLARQSEVMDLIRAVGPSLVIALLMDGPQLPERWSARYASVLADDPGSAVLTLSSIGMVCRSRPRDTSQSRSVGLWNSAGDRMTPLELESDATALLLNLCAVRREEHTADGRGDGAETDDLVLAGLHQIRG